MSWSKLKTIIIYILLLLNLFLLGLVGMNRFRAQRYQTAALTEAAAVLAQNNIRTQLEELPREMKLSAAVAARDLQKEERLASVLLGGDVQTTASGGGLYVYEGEAGTARFRGNGEFTVDLTRPVESTLTPQSLMKSLDLDIWQVRAEDNAAEQSLNGVPVYSAGSAEQRVAGVTFSYDGEGRLSAVSGWLHLGKLTAEQEENSPISVSTGLMAFFGFVVDNGDVCREIVSMTSVYRAAGGSARLTPTWLIRTDTGGYFVDAINAEVSRVPGE